MCPPIPSVPVAISHTRYHGYNEGIQCQGYTFSKATVRTYNVTVYQPERVPGMTTFIQEYAPYLARYPPATYLGYVVLGSAMNTKHSSLIHLVIPNTHQRGLTGAKYPPRREDSSFKILGSSEFWIPGLHTRIQRYVIVDSWALDAVACPGVTQYRHSPKGEIGHRNTMTV